MCLSSGWQPDDGIWETTDCNLTMMIQDEIGRRNCTKRERPVILIIAPTTADRDIYRINDMQQAYQPLRCHNPLSVVRSTADLALWVRGNDVDSTAAQTGVQPRRKRGPAWCRAVRMRWCFKRKQQQLRRFFTSALKEATIRPLQIHKPPTQNYDSNSRAHSIDGFEELLVENRSGRMRVIKSKAKWKGTHKCKNTNSIIHYLWVDGMLLCKSVKSVE